MSVGQLLRWSEREQLVPVPDVDGIAPAPLLAADSFLVTDGKVRGLASHRERFFGSCPAYAVRAGQLDLFWQRAVAALPRSGRWFPRVELVGGAVPTLQLRIRPAPAPGHSIRMLRWPEPDPRKQPRRKGPDLAMLASMRQQAVASGADEAILTTPRGIVLEGLTTSLLWWEGDVLCAPDPHLRVLPSVTSALLLALARQRKIRTAYRRRHIGQLDGLPVWTVNALHGIRPVVAWEGSPWPNGGTRDHAPLHDQLLDLADCCGVQHP
ncbi:MAG: aminotransferase class IV [Pseudomonadota bacterium]